MAVNASFLRSKVQVLCTILIRIERPMGDIAVKLLDGQNMI